MKFNRRSVTQLELLASNSNSEARPSEVDEVLRAPATATSDLDPTGDTILSQWLEPGDNPVGEPAPVNPASSPRGVYRR
jgi:hypothetical protein